MHIEAAPVELRPDATGLSDELFARVAGPYRQIGDWLVLAPYTGPADLCLRAFNSAAADGAAPFDAFQDALLGMEVRPELIGDIAETNHRVRRDGEVLFDWSGSLADKAVTVLRHADTPLTTDQIAGLVQPAVLGSMKTQMADHPQLVRVGIDQWALSSWGLEHYEGITPAMVARLTEQEPRNIDDLAAEMHEQFGIAAASVVIMASTNPTFVREGSLVRRRHPDEPYIPSGALETAPNCVHIDGRWALRRRVDHDLRRGSGFAVPEAFAVALGMQPFQKGTFRTQFGETNMSWSHMPIIGSMRRVAEKLGANERDVLLLILNEPGDVEVRLERTGG